MKNNARFDIERSRDESLSFEKIGSVSAAAYPDIENHYSFLDPAPWPGINYYRLKQVDLDGKWTYSKTISIDNSRDELIVFPNPANNQIWIGRQSKASAFLITNTAGQTLKSGTTKGDEYLDIQELPAGIYFLQMNQQNLLFTKK
ncbi:MAG: T9SS type A sorting domain-containing protein [Bacteroidetes bacterium]|nr:T9SS type A sorting domain-containing protein [Bacteroidota bacterium]